MRIRLIEPDGEVAAALRTALREAGHEVDSAAPAAAEPDVVVAGLPAAPDTAPDEALRSPIVVLVGDARPGEIRRWIEGRPRWVVVGKPVRPETLLAAVDDAVSKAPRRASH